MTKNEFLCLGVRQGKVYFLAENQSNTVLVGFETLKRTRRCVKKGVVCLGKGGLFICLRPIQYVTHSSEYCDNISNLFNWFTLYNVKPLVRKFSTKKKV